VPLAAGLLVQARPNPTSGDITLAVRTDQTGPATLWLTEVLGRQLGQQTLKLVRQSGSQANYRIEIMH